MRTLNVRGEIMMLGVRGGLRILVVRDGIRIRGVRSGIRICGVRSGIRMLGVRGRIMNMMSKVEKGIWCQRCTRIVNFEFRNGIWNMVSEV